VWESAAAAGRATATCGWDASIEAGAVPAWAEEIAARAPVEEGALAGILRLAAASFGAELRAAESACIPGAWECACVRSAWFGVLVREFVRFAPPAGPGVPAARAEAFGGVVASACRALDGWIGRLVAAAGEDATVLVVGERGIDLGHWRSPAALLGGGGGHGAGAWPSVLVVSGRGVPPDSLRFGTVSTDVAGIVRSALGLGDPPVASTARPALPSVPAACMTDDVLEVVQARDRAFAISAAMTGESDAAIEAACRAVARRPPDVADALLLSELMLGADRPGEAIDALDACRAARGARAEDGTAGSWALGLARSRALAAAGRGTEALAEVDAAAAVGAPASEVGVARALASEAIGDWASSERAAREAIGADGSCRPAHVVLARALFRQERYADAAAAAREALGLGWADPAMHLLLGTSLAADRRPGESIAALVECLRLSPEHPAALRRLAAVHARQLGDVAAAEGFIARALAAERGASGGPGPRRG
jgi:tetratricopeptide (TPR) repeat protein